MRLFKKLFCCHFWAEFSESYCYLLKNPVTKKDFSVELLNFLRMLDKKVVVCLKCGKEKTVKDDIQIIDGGLWRL